MKLEATALTAADQTQIEPRSSFGRIGVNLWLLKNQPAPPTSMLMLAAASGFMGGMAVMAALVMDFPAGVPTPTGPAAPSPVVSVRPSPIEAPPAVSPPAPAVITLSISADPVGVLAARRLDLPVTGAKRTDLRDTFGEHRGSARRHEAIDLLAPRHTPVVAVEDGTIAKLFLSDAGGITLYQFDPTTTYVYYYAHLQAYADGLKEGDRITRGEVLGYVGTTGNAPPDTPHLHFAIFQMTNQKQWWQGTPIDPYKVLR